MRIAEFTRDELTDEQKRVWDKIASGPRGRVPNMIQPMLRSPRLADITQQLGAFCRYETSLPPRLSEFAILIVARHTTAQLEWHAHQPLAIQGGLAPEIADAIEARQRPDFQNDDEETIYDLAMGLLNDFGVSDAVFQRALDVLGEVTLGEVVGILGYYRYVAMIINCYQVTPGEEGPRMLE